MAVGLEEYARPRKPLLGRFASHDHGLDLHPAVIGGDEDVIPGGKLQGADHRPECPPAEIKEGGLSAVERFEEPSPHPGMEQITRVQGGNSVMTRFPLVMAFSRIGG